MATTAKELDGNLVVDFGDNTTYTIYPVPGSVGMEIQAMLVGIALGTTAHEHGPEKLMADTERATQLALGMPEQGAKRKLRKAPNRTQQAAQARFQEFKDMRAARQTLVAQAALLWNTGGGGIDAVMDLLDEDGGYPKGLGRVMQSSGLGDQWKILRTWLDGVGLTSETASTPSPTGGPNTSV